MAVVGVAVEFYRYLLDARLPVIGEMPNRADCLPGWRWSLRARDQAKVEVVLRSGSETVRVNDRSGIGQRVAEWDVEVLKVNGCGMS